MRIAFDLDDTLIPGLVEFPLEPEPRNWVRRWLCSERLRLGTPALLNQLWAHGHEVWIYTTSFRSSFSTKMLFRAYRTRVSNVINVPVHQRAIRKLGERFKMCTKFPPAFQIDLLIDNCAGFALEAQNYSFAMLQIDPSDSEWATTIRQHLRIT